jgi:exopolyphosphatase/guanosine-5'-triphosphate,3'-diphosphate pyrophosphatase
MRLAAFDIGTNSIRMAIVDMFEDGNWSAVANQKDVVRLGDGEFSRGHARLTPEAIDRAVHVMARYADVARGYGTDHIVALATAASREAENQQDFVDAIRDVRVISGHEEARLIYLGIRSGIDLPKNEKALFLDIGGGSSELVVGDSSAYYFLDSMRLGAIRITNMFLSGKTGPVGPTLWAKLQEKVKNTLTPAAREIARLGFNRMYGSSGTIMTLAEIASRRSRANGSQYSTLRNYELTLSDLQDITSMLCKMSLEERKKTPGITPERGDIIIGGAAILQTVMEALGAKSIIISDRGLREGIVIDQLIRSDETREKLQEESVRLSSVNYLARKCGVDEDHAAHVKQLSLSLFDQTRALGLHDLTSSRELLEYAATLHDSGFFISHTNHQQHSYYIIRNSELLGFNDIEIEIMAQTAYYHRKGAPRKKHEQFSQLTPHQQQAVTVLSCCLRLAEALDRGHLTNVEKIDLAFEENRERVAIRVQSRENADISLERSALANHREVFEKTFNVLLVIANQSVDSHVKIAA